MSQTAKNARRKAIEDVKKLIQQRIDNQTQQEDESALDPCGGPRQHWKKGEWLGCPWELRFYTELLKEIDAL